MILWYIQGDVAYYHLRAYSPLGYETHCSFAFFWHAIQYFIAGGLKWLNLGAGTRRDATDGLNRFKRGWSTGTRVAYFCGHIFGMGKCAEAVNATGMATTEYFPAYRMGEFG
jgi:lipid II:glycine glycyltransferase (peptidoglycan interpeptide bridge formation enzyme)